MSIDDTLDLSTVHRPTTPGQYGSDYTPAHIHYLPATKTYVCKAAYLGCGQSKK